MQPRSLPPPVMQNSSDGDTLFLPMKIHVRSLLLGALAAACCHAQFDSATVLGTVHDPSGSVIAGAKITLRNVNTAVTAATVTNSAGNYELLTVKIGDYT